MGLILQQIAKAESRAAGMDVAALAAAARGRHPDQLADAQARQARHDFLAASLDRPGEAETVFERILQGNELQPVSYFERGAIAARSVARVAIRGPGGQGWGTGFLIAPQVLLTNHHVLPDQATARGSLAQFAYEIDLEDRPIGPVSFALDPARLFETSTDLDFTAVAVQPRSDDRSASLEGYGFLPLLETPGKAFEGEWLTIVQHPAGERKQVCVRENRLLKREGSVLWYSTDTLAGSSGSPVFNNDWYVVALHHSGVPDRGAGGAIRTVDGRDYDPRSMDETSIKWVANEGIRASVIAAALRQRRAADPLLRPMFEATPQTARILAPPTASAIPVIAAPTLPPAAAPAREETVPMSQATSAGFPVEIRLRVEADGSAHLLDGRAMESAPLEATPRTAERTATFDAPFDPDYAGRKGYDPGFLGGKVEVDLPQLSPALKDAAAPLLPPAKAGEVVLKYHNYSLVMHARRRLAIYSAANIDFGHRFDMTRPKDDWRTDPRIKAEHQLQGWYYTGNQFDRGHLTRREDLEYGPDRLVALQSAADTCHWTNCTPQHARFNQNKEIWQGIERYILERSRELHQTQRAVVITGPLLDEGDPEYRKVQYPLDFWKVVAALDDKGTLFATAYRASQREVIAEFGVEAAPFGAYGTFQTRVAEIERLTGLTFMATVNGEKKRLSTFDPLEARRPVARRSAVAATESASSRVPLPAGIVQVAELDDIVL